MNKMAKSKRADMICLKMTCENKLTKMAKQKFI